jgi:hypothetical protein
MTVLTYIWKIIDKFGLFGRLDNKGLAEVHLELEAQRLMESGLPQHSISVLKRVEDLEREKIVRNKLEAQREEFAKELQTDLPWDVESPVQRFDDELPPKPVPPPLKDLVEGEIKKTRKPRAKKTPSKRKKTDD